MKKLSVCLAGLLVSAGLALAGEKGVMHCFTFTPIDTASQAEWDAFHKASAGLPQKIKGLKQVWTGKLMRPLPVWGLNVADAEARKKLNSEGKGTADVTLNRREHGACMWFEDEAAYKAYGSDPAHKEWVSVYEKVRKPGTTTFQIVGQ
jgi:hypothetical protein